MGKKRIKKKDAVLPFRQTVAFRFIMVAISALLFAIAVFQLLRAIQTANTTLLVVAAVLTVATAALALFNLGQMRHAKVPRSTQQRMRRR